MIMQRTLDNNLYLGKRKGVELYFFGYGCLARYYSKTFAHLDDIDVSIASFSNGANSISQVISSVIQKNDSTPLDREDVLERIYSLINKGVLVARKKLPFCEMLFVGEYGKYYPIEITIEMTNVCNFNCKFCYKEAGFYGKYISDDTINEVNNIINGKVNNILLTGGEPTLHPHFREYIKLFSQYASVCMISNGSELYRYDEDTIELLDMIQFSLYGCSDIEYEKATGISNGFTRLCKSVEMVKKRNIPFKIAVTLSKATIDNIEKFIQTAVSFGARSITIGVAELFGRELTLYQEDNEYRKKVKNLPDELLKYKQIYQGKIEVKLNNIDTEHIRGFKSNKNSVCNIHDGCLNCGCGTEHLVISQDGKLRACQLLPEKEFNMGGLEQLKMYIEGDFQKEKLRQSIISFYQKEKFDEKNISPCNALRDYYSRYIHRQPNQ